MAGKAILAMGKAVVRSAEYLMISRRLSAIKRALPCSDRGIQQQNDEAIFDDLLELSRYASVIRLRPTLRIRMLLPDHYSTREPLEWKPCN
jgi:hypothetical protein